MPWLIIHGRERELLVSGAERGVPLYTRDPARALRFDNADKARKWIDANTVTAFGELALLREIPNKKNPAQAGQPGGATSSKESSCDHSAIPAVQPQA